MRPRWQADLQTGITGDAAGRDRAGARRRRTAAALIAALQGGVTILMSTGSSRHLEAALDTALLFLHEGTA